jgi:hypothetical protein
MKTVWLVVFLLLAQLCSYGRDSAYQALRALGAQRGQGLLDHVIEVQGLKGSPQPSVWRIRVEDPAARGGIREVEISGGRIISERTPVRMAMDSPEAGKMDFHSLNLDSAGAFTIADQETKKARTGFDSVDYLLRRDPAKNRPIWELRLADESGRQVGLLTIGADNGNILREEGIYPSSAHGGGQQAQPQGRVSDNQNQTDDDSVTVPKIANKIGRGMRHIGGNLENFFTGRRTIDQGDR